MGTSQLPDMNCSLHSGAVLYPTTTVTHAEQLYCQAVGQSSSALLLAPFRPHAKPIDACFETVPLPASKRFGCGNVDTVLLMACGTNFLCRSPPALRGPAAAFARTKDPSEVIGADVVSEEVRSSGLVACCC